MARSGKFMVKCLISNRQGKPEIAWMAIRAVDEEDARTSVVETYKSILDILQVVPSDEYVSKNGGKVLTNPRWR